MSVLRSEWTKLRSVRGTWIAVAATVLSGLALSVLGASDQLGGPVPPGWDPTGASLKGFLFAQLVIGMFGALAITPEYGTGTITTSLAIVPSRTRLLAAKAVLVAAGALGTGLLTTALSFGVVQAMLAASDLPRARLGDPGVVSALAGAPLYLTAVAVLGLALGTLARSTASALAALVVALLLVPAVGGAFGDRFSRYWPVTAGQSVYAVVRTDGDLAPWPGFAVLAVAVAAVGAAAAVAFRRRDH